MSRFTFLLACLPLALAADLKITLKAIHSSVPSVDDIAFSSTVTNPTDKDIRVFAKSNVLDDSETSSFVVTKGDLKANFTGIRAYYDLNSDEVYKIIPAGKSVTVNHTNVGSLYDFASLGAGEFTFTPKNLFQVDPNSDPIELNAESVKVNVTNHLVSNKVILVPRTSTPTCPNSARLKVLKDSLSGAKTLAKQASQDISNHPNGLIKTYFKTNSRTDIKNRFNLIANDHGTRKIHCNNVDPAKLCSGGGVVAYTYLFTSNGKIVGSDIYTCNNFFTSIPSLASTCKQSGTINNSKPSVILHEMSHATANTADVAYFCDPVKKLSAKDSKRNADSYQCMALAVHKKYHC